MKTFNCTQCGASVRRLSLKDRWAHCDYCKAKFLLPEEKRPVVTGLSFGVITASDPDGDDAEFGPLAKAVGVVFLLAIIVFSGIKVQEEIQARQNADREAKEALVREENKIPNVPVRVDWDDGPDDVLHYELPAVGTIAFAAARGLDKTPGAKEVVVVEVKLDPQGNVREAEMITGNMVLYHYSTKAARTTVFSPNPKKKTRKIIYTFG
jgi:hypothetical protein